MSSGIHDSDSSIGIINKILVENAINQNLFILT